MNVVRSYQIIHLCPQLFFFLSLEFPSWQLSLCLLPRSSCFLFTQHPVHKLTWVIQGKTSINNDTYKCFQTLGEHSKTVRLQKHCEIAVIYSVVASAGVWGYGHGRAHTQWITTISEIFFWWSWLILCIILLQRTRERAGNYDRNGKYTFVVNRLYCL